MSDINRPEPATAPDNKDAHSVAGERHVSEVAGPPSRVSRRTGVGVLIAGTAVACGVILLSAKKPDLQLGTPPVLPARPVVRYEPPPLPIAPPLPPVADASLPPLPAIETAPPAPPPKPRLLVYTSTVEGIGADPVRTRSGTSSGPAPSDSAEWGAASGQLTPSPANPQGATDDSMRSRLTPTQLTGVSANVLKNQPFLLTMGTVSPCVLQTAMDSTLPGFVTCVIPQDVKGKTGLTLLDRGTRVVGEFRGGVRQGFERLFVVWTRAETPQGVVVSLDSPASDPLGRAGLPGEVDRHFWQRFGGALLLSTIDGAIQAGVAASAKEGTTTINTGQTQSIIAETLRGSINIPPTVRKNQGELVSIFVARDLDFSTVYAVKAKEEP